MGIVNRRNAVLGWIVWNIGKRFGKRKAREAVPGIDRDTKRPNRPALISALAALGGALWIFGKKKKKRRSASPESE